MSTYQEACLHNDNEECVTHSPVNVAMLLNDVVDDENSIKKKVHTLRGRDQYRRRCSRHHTTITTITTTNNNNTTTPPQLTHPPTTTITL